TTRDTSCRAGSISRSCDWTTSAAYAASSSRTDSLPCPLSCPGSPRPGGRAPARAHRHGNAPLPRRTADVIRVPATVYLLRHGQSEANAGEATPSPEAAGLTAVGRLQSRALAAALDAAPELIVVSRFRRARETAAEAHARFPEARIEEWPVH